MAVSHLSLPLLFSSNKIIKAHISEQRCWNLETTLRGWKPWPGGRWLIFAAPALPAPGNGNRRDGRPSSKHFIIAPNRVSQTTFGDLQPSEARAGNHATLLLGGRSELGQKRDAAPGYGMEVEVAFTGIQSVPFRDHNMKTISRFSQSLRENHWKGAWESGR